MKLQNKEKQSYLQAFMFIASSDGIITVEEITALKNIADSMGFNKEKINYLAEEVKKGKKLKDILAKIKNRQSKLLLIYELILLCHADGKYSDSEKSSMKELTALLNVETEKLVQIENLVDEHIDLKEKLNLVLESNEF
ncbi:MAG: DUF533 domain-containing protein [Sedimentibacter sp.]|uniref:DUF533 domain-containing protein n=1 Tax=Sedimentibacter sp. TaxID=1960295 RepID=UPI0031586230